MEWQLVVIWRQSLGLPGCVERIEKTPCAWVARTIAKPTVRMQREPIARKREQDVVTRLRVPAHHAFEQARIALRKRSGRREQIAPAGQGTPMAGHA